MNESTKEDLNILLNSLAQQAQFLLSKNHKFYPIAQTLDEKNKVTLQAFEPVNLNQDADEIIKEMLSMLKQSRTPAKIKAIGFAKNMIIVLPDTNKESHAIKIVLEHKSKHGLEAFIPYSKGLLGKYKYGDILFQKQQ